MAAYRHLCILVSLLVYASQCSSHLSREASSALVSKEHTIFKEIRNYQQTRAVELDRLKSKIERIEQEHNEVRDDLETFFGNPLNAYRIIKRLVIDWDLIHAFIANANTTQDFIAKWSPELKRMNLPGVSELRDAIGHLIDVQDAVDGASADMIYGPLMRWDECYEVAVHLFDTENFNDALTWFEATLEKLKHDDGEYSDDFQVDVMEYIAFSQYLLGDGPGAYATWKSLGDTPLASANSEEVKMYLLLNANSFSFARVIEHGVPHFTSVHK